MPKITYVTNDGSRHDVDVDEGLSIMEGAINHGIEGIVAECGGACSCATCHSYIAEDWVAKVPPREEMEDFILEDVEERKASSRLTCQISVTQEMEGLVVYVAEN